ncbi:MAG TPA: hypothetical protein DF296_06585 [Candidatus Margulisbacteria bacterium]|nr:MAG: hypothetical protein A2X42_01115 [Candidatus Margulisbacteria bacterium GWF2_38_17]OGI11116.1 MAG: hypothetical protein A2X41_02410 [Candidatus Margulisbacteria bacterium GWE2_39_32]HCT84850.1 hypothetical protein [Candidatus Margulisiibacteriota bacterium]
MDNWVIAIIVIVVVVVLILLFVGALYLGKRISKSWTNLKKIIQLSKGMQNQQKQAGFRKPQPQHAHHKKKHRRK